MTLKKMTIIDFLSVTGIVRAPASYKISRSCLNKAQGMQLNIQEISASLSRTEAYF